MKKIYTTLCMLIMTGVVFFTSDLKTASATPLSDAIMRNNVTLVKQLVLSGYSIEARNKDGLTPLLLAIDGGNKEIIKFLLDNKANINAAARYGMTPLMRAVAHKEKSIVQLILSYKPDLSLKSIQGLTALDFAYENPFRGVSEHIEIVYAEQANKYELSSRNIMVRVD